MKEKINNQIEKEKKGGATKVIFILVGILAIILYIAILYFLYWAEIITKGWVAFLCITPFIIALIIGGIYLLLKKQYFIDKGFYESTMIYPADACQLIKQYFYDEHGVLMDVMPRVNTSPSVKKGQDPLLHGYLYNRHADFLQSFTIPLNRGKEAILKGIINIWDDRPLPYNKKMESDFVANKNISPVDAIFQGLSPSEKQKALGSVGKDTPNVLISPEFSFESPKFEEKEDENAEA